MDQPRLLLVLIVHLHVNRHLTEPVGAVQPLDRGDVQVEQAAAETSAAGGAFRRDGHALEQGVLVEEAIPRYLHAIQAVPRAALHFVGDVHDAVPQIFLEIALHRCFEVAGALQVIAEIAGAFFHQIKIGGAFFVNRQDVLELSVREVRGFGVNNDLWPLDHPQDDLLGLRLRIVDSIQQIHAGGEQLLVLVEAAQFQGGVLQALGGHRRSGLEFGFRGQFGRRESGVALPHQFADAGLLARHDFKLDVGLQAVGMGRRVGNHFGVVIPVDKHQPVDRRNGLVAFGVGVQFAQLHLGDVDRFQRRGTGFDAASRYGSEEKIGRGMKGQYRAAVRTGSQIHFNLRKAPAGVKPRDTFAHRGRVVVLSRLERKAVAEALAGSGGIETDFAHGLGHR